MIYSFFKMVFMYRIMMLLFLVFFFRSASAQTFTVTDFKPYKNNTLLFYKDGLVSIYNNTTGENKLISYFVTTGNYRDEQKTILNVSNRHPLLMVCNDSKQLLVFDCITETIKVLDTLAQYVTYRGGLFSTDGKHFILFNKIYNLETGSKRNLALPATKYYGQLISYDASTKRGIFSSNNIGPGSEGNSFQGLIEAYTEGGTSVEATIGKGYFLQAQNGNWLCFFSRGEGVLLVYNPITKVLKKIPTKVMAAAYAISSDGQYVLQHKQGTAQLINTATGASSPIDASGNSTAFGMDEDSRKVYKHSLGKLTVIDIAAKSNKTMPVALPYNLEQLLPCKETYTRIGEFAAKGNPFGTASNGEIAWPQPPGGVIEVETAYRDINYDGFEDIILSYTQTKYMDLIFGNGKGGYTGYYRIITKGAYPDAVVGDSALDIVDASKQKLLEVKLSSDFKRFEVFEVATKVGDNLNPYCRCYIRNAKIDTIITGHFSNMPKDSIGIRTGIALPKIDFNKDGLEDKLTKLIYKESPKKSPNDLRHPEDVWAVSVRKGGINDKQGAVFPVPAEPFTIETGDFDGDGWLDFVAGFDKFSGFHFYFNKGGDEGFEEKVIKTSFGDYYHFESLDYDDDGLSDISIKDRTTLYLIGSDAKRNLSIKKSYQHIKFSEFSYQTITDLNYDGMMDYVSISTTRLNSSGNNMYLYSYLGNKKSGSYELTGAKDISWDINAMRKAYPILPKSTKPAATTAATLQRKTKGVLCDKCEGKGVEFVSGYNDCIACAAVGSFGSSCGWCGGGGQLHSDYYNNTNGRKETSSRSCPKCNGGFSRGGGGKCFACKGKKVVYYSGYQNCSKCSGLRYVFYYVN